MAEGRMLKKVVSESQKLPQLKTDSARLLWTWILPYLDIEGRFFADPNLVKGKVVPRLNTFNPENITEYLNDMARVGLIILYEIDGEKYLQFRNFKELQNLRDDREAKSKIPAPKVPKKSVTPGVLQESAGNTPTEFNLIKDNIKQSLNKASISNKSLPNDSISIITKSPINNSISISDSNADNNSISILLKKEFGEDVDVNFYLENYINEKIREPFKYLQKILRNEDGKIRRIKKPLEKSIPIPEGYQIVLDSSSKNCSKCHNPMTRISKERTDEILLFCEYCGSMEAEKINLKLIHQVMQEAKKTINEQKTIN